MTLVLGCTWIAVVALIAQAVRMHGHILRFKYEAAYERHRASMLEVNVRDLKIATRELKTEVELLKSGAPYR